MAEGAGPAAPDAVVVNGEIYNFVSLREELIAKGVKAVSPPVTPTIGPNTGGRAVYMIDPDGIRVEFIQNNKGFGDFSQDEANKVTGGGDGHGHQRRDPPDGGDGHLRALLRVGPFQRAIGTPGSFSRSRTTATSLQFVKNGQRTHSFHTFCGNSITFASRNPCFSKKPGL